MPFYVCTQVHGGSLSSSSLSEYALFLLDIGGDRRVSVSSNFPLPRSDQNNNQLSLFLFCVMESRCITCVQMFREYYASIEVEF